MIAALFNDLRHAVRHFAQRPALTLTMVGVLALGMAIATALFSVLRAFTMQPAPGISQADDLVRIRGVLTAPEGKYPRGFTREELDAQSALTTVFREVAGWSNTTVAVERKGTDEPDWVAATFVTENYFDVLGVRTAAGPGLPRAKSGEQPLVAVISHALRERHFPDDAAAIGATLTVADRPVTVVGVAPPRFGGVDEAWPHKLWLPDAARSAIDPSRQAPRYGAAARLRPGVDRASASAAVGALATHASVADATTADVRETPSSDVQPMVSWSGDPNFENEVPGMTLGLTLLGMLVLLVTGTNASALQTGLAMTRGREIAVRLSLGASRWRVLRQLLTESALLGLVAGAAALALLFAAQHLDGKLVAGTPLLNVGIDWASVAFTFGVALAAGTLAGLSPALHASRTSVATALRTTSGGSSAKPGRLQRSLVVVQVLLTQPLVVGLTAMVLALVGEYRREAIHDSAHDVALLRLRAARVEATPIDATIEVERLARRLESLPGVTSAIHDPRRSIDLERYVAADAPKRVDAAIDLDVQLVAPGWFEVMDHPIRIGRAFGPGDPAPLDTRNERPVVVGEDLARAMWPGGNPIGRRLVPPAESSDPPLVVVGVAQTRPGTERQAGDAWTVFMPAPAEATQIALLVRLRGDEAAALREIRKAVHEVAPALGIFELRTRADVDEETRGLYLMGTGLLAGLGLLALLLAGIGLYAVVAHAVTQRTGEIAVRIAVGARAGQVVRRTMGEGLRLVAYGLVAGMPLSLFGLAVVVATPGMMPPVALWQVAATAFAGVVALAALATWVPARRAAAVEPASVLRGD